MIMTAYHGLGMTHACCCDVKSGLREHPTFSGPFETDLGDIRFITVLR
jgi:hypothetical protein